MGIRPVSKELWKAVQGMEGGMGQEGELENAQGSQFSGDVTDLLRRGFTSKSDLISTHGMP